MHLFRQMADVQTADMLKLPVPEIEGGKPRIVRAPATPELKAFVAALAKRAEKLKTGNVDPRKDNMLKITGEGRKAALDLRLMRPATPDHGESKVNLAVKEVFSVWRETQEQRLTQLVFCDLSTPHAEAGRLSVYQDMKAKLMALGVPGNEIQFIHYHESDAAKLTLFKDVRAGRVRVLMGSTQKMGAGTNVQAKLVGLHHLDAPWRPADIEQREGRIRRQGNTNATIRILRYVTEGSFDAYMWQSSGNFVPVRSRDEPKHLVVRAQAWRHMLETGQAANRLALARRFGLTPGAVTRIMKLVELLPEIQNFLASLQSKPAIRHFGMKKMGSLAALPTDAQRAAFERIRRAFAQTTPELTPGEPLKPYRPTRTLPVGATDAERIIALLRENGPSSPREIGAAVNLSRISVYRRLTAMVTAGQVTSAGFHALAGC